MTGTYGVGEDTRSKSQVPDSPIEFDHLVFKISPVTETVSNVTEVPLDDLK